MDMIMSLGFIYQVQLWIRANDPDVLCWNPIIGVFENQAELVWVTIECTYVLPDVRVHPIPFGSKKTNSLIWERPDGLRLVRGAQFERFRNGLITPRIRVRTLNKGAWKRKGAV